MRFKNWLLTSTTVGMLALAPVVAFAQSSAYQRLQEAEASGDAGAVEAARTAFAEECIAAGFTSPDECIAAITAPADEPQPEPEAPPAPEPEAPLPDAPVEEPQPEAAPVEPPVVEPEPVAEPPVAVPVAEQPAQQPPVDDDRVDTQPDPTPVEQAAEPPADPGPVEQPAEPPAADQPFAEQPPAEQPAEAPVTDQPALEQPEPEQPAPQVMQAPAETVSEAPAEQAPSANADLSGALGAQVDIYNAAAADLMTGGDASAAQAQAAQARAELESLCASAGYATVEECLTANGLSLPAVPALETVLTGEPAAPPSADSAVPTPPEPPTDNAAGQPADAPVDEAVEMVEDLPEGVTVEDIAPVLDSAKDAAVAPSAPAPAEAPVDAGTPSPQPEPAAAPVVPPAPPPANDTEAQSDIIYEDPAAISAVAEQGQVVEIQAIEPVTLPQNVTIVEQTNIVNNITNNITNNTQNNTVINDSSTNITVDNRVNYGDFLTNVVVQVGSQLIINNRAQDTSRFIEYGTDEIYYERLPNGRLREVVIRPDGSEVITVRNRNGDIVQRSRITPDGREYVLAYFDDRYAEGLLEWRDPALDLPPLRLNIPVSEYVLDARYASAQQVETFFSQPPVEQVQRLYSIDEVKRSARVRDSVRRLEVGNLTFDTGSANVSRDQVQALSAVATAMQQLLLQNPAETFLIEGHTDAVGADLFNLQLSDARAATIARILTDFYGIPPENLATQGYGERYLKIRTELAERENRRVTIRRITPLITPMVPNAG